jgi:hypothetical protein
MVEIHVREGVLSGWSAIGAWGDFSPARLADA